MKKKKGKEKKGEGIRAGEVSRIRNSKRKIKKRKERQRSRKENRKEIMEKEEYKK